MKGRWLILGMALWCGLGAAAPVQGAEEQPLWEVGAGVAVLNLPDYRGSDERRWLALPFPYLVYRGEILRVERERVSGRIFKSDRVLLDFSLMGSMPVESKDNAARAGMPDLDPTFEVGPSLQVRLWEGEDRQARLNLMLPLRAVFSTDFSSVRREGWVFHPKLVLEKREFIPGSGLNFGLSAGPLFADREYHRYFYRVEPAYARTGRPAYDPRGGYSGTSLALGLNKRWERLIVNGFVSYDLLDGAEFIDSPLVKRKNSVMAGVTFSWIFWSSPRRVEAEP